MKSISEQQTPSEEIINMPQMIGIADINQPLTASTTMEDINSTGRFNDFTHRLDEIGSMFSSKQKSMVSVYDNNPQQQGHSLVGIIGRNRRSQAFFKRLVLSGFSRPILCDVNSTQIDLNDPSGYVSYEAFYQYSPTMVLITDDLATNFEDFFPRHKPQVIIDTREMVAKNSSLPLSTIPSSYRAFGNLSDWEIENGTERIGVAVEQSAPSSVIQFICKFKSFPRGLFLLDHYSYQNQSMRAFRKCRFPSIAAILIFAFWFILSLIEQNLDNDHPTSILQQASSITALTSVTLLALLFLIAPLFELIELISRNNENTIAKLIFIERWLPSRRYLSWYSLSFALLHLLFVLFSKLDLLSNISIFAFFFGLLALILLLILSSVHVPWISERLLWQEYHIFTAYLGPVSLLLAFVHLALYWNRQSHLFNLKFLSLIFPLLVLILHLIIYGLVRPIQWIRNRRLKQDRS